MIKLQRGRDLLACAVAIVLAGLLIVPGAAGGTPARAMRAPTPAPPATPAPAAQALALVFALRVRGAALQRFAYAVNTPGNPLYGHFESVARLAARFGAPPPEIARTVRFLRAHRARQVRVDATHLFVYATLPVALAERLFATRLARFRTRQGAYTAPASPVVIPRALRGAVSAVIGLSTRPIVAAPTVARPGPAARFGLRAARRAGASGLRARAAQSAQPSSAYEPATGTPAGCQAADALGAFTPNQYLTAYGYSALQQRGIDGQGERVALIEIDGFNESDLDTFASCFGLRVPRINVFGVGLHRALRAGPEATLDLEVLDAAAPGLRAIDVYESSPQEADALRALTAPLQSRGYKPQVISASLGLCEPFAEQAVGRAGLAASNDALALAAASGISFLDSAGDTGSAGCTQGPAGQPIPALAVNYPASSPFVTGVGGTNIALNAANQITGQIVWNDANLQPGSAGGGGFSNIFARPAYQAGTVAGDRRAVPDVSMLADIAPGYAIYCTAPGCASPTGAWQVVGGTSAAAPLLAGGFALVDQQLRAHARQDLGLANPLLYEIGRSSRAASVFYNVTQYGNDVGPWITSDHRLLGCCTAHSGFNEAAGWGSVNVAGLLSGALALQRALVHIGLHLPRQRPLRARRVIAEVFCSGRCLVALAAAFRIDGGRPFAVRSAPYLLRRRGGRRISLALRGAVLRRLRNAAAHRRRIFAEVTAELVDPAGNVESRRVARLGL
jgi:subtilase family serine protease